jgi:hypothetical protein
VRPRSKILVAGAALLLLAPTTLLVPEVRVRAEVAWFGHGLRSTNPMTRADARRSLLALGRPAIDSHYAELVAGEAEDEWTGQDALVFVGALLPGEPRTYRVESVLLGAAPATIPVTGTPVCPTALLLRRPTTRALVVAARVPTAALLELRLEVPLDDAPEAAIVALVRERLGK